MPGITARLEHIAGLGVDAIWISPFYVSPMADAGYGEQDGRGPADLMLGNHDVVRHPTRLTLKPGQHPDGIAAADPQPDENLGLRRGRAASAIMLALPGCAYLYQGEELGLPEHTTLPDDARQDPTWFRNEGAVAGRDGCRVPTDVTVWVLAGR